MRRKIACIDFDGTIVHHRFPDIGEPLPGAFDVMKELKEAGWVLVLNTCREDEKRPYLSEAIAYCKENGVVFDGVNSTPLDFEFRPEHSPRRKAYGNVYIDDRNLGGFPGWDVVRQALLQGEELRVKLLKEYSE